MNIFSKVVLTAGLLAGMAMMGCEKKAGGENEGKNVAPTVVVPLSGTYTWNFSIPGLGDQVSKMTFVDDAVVYDMAGPAYTTIYTMTKESYSEANNLKRWIGVGKGGSINKDGVYFVLFFKDITDNSVAIYKRECENKAEAESFAYPAADATADHGWNMYQK